MSDMISIIIPAYNAADYLAQTIESVLNQTYSDFELILIDDGSTDRTREIIKDYQCKDARIKYFYKENGGVSSARNLGLQKATGDFVSFLDSDDLWDRRFLESINCFPSCLHKFKEFLGLFVIFRQKKFINLFLRNSLNLRPTILSTKLFHLLQVLYLA